MIEPLGPKLLMTQADKKTLVNRIKGNQPCAECDLYFHYRDMDFHHLDPSMKTGSISSMVKDNQAWDMIQEEIDKCVALCANCHRRVTRLMG